MLLNDLYYDRGFFLTELDQLTKSLLWNEIVTTNWITDTVDNIYKQIPDWYKSNVDIKNITGTNRSEYERIIGDHIIKHAPKSLIDIGNHLVETAPFDFFKKYYKRHELKFVDMWNGSEEIPYHFDTINGSDTLVLIYLTDQLAWDKEWGGTISMKKQVGDNIVFEQEYLPISGTMLIVNNANPLIYHKVTALTNPNVNRYTFSFNYNWF
jgi:hypothetical protein